MSCMAPGRQSQWGPWRQCSPQCTQAWILPAALALDAALPQSCPESWVEYSVLSMQWRPRSQQPLLQRNVLLSFLPSFTQHVSTKHHSSSDVDWTQCPGPPSRSPASWPSWLAYHTQRRSFVTGEGTCVTRLVCHCNCRVLQLEITEKAKSDLFWHPERSHQLRH